MEGYELGKDVQEIKDRLSRIEEYTGLSRDNTPFGALGERTQLVISNKTFRDFWVEMTKDVHTGHWGPRQINHNGEADAQSKRIDAGDKATFHLIVTKNDAGKPGVLIVEFDHGVRYNAA